MKNEILIHPEELTKKWIDRMADAGISVLGLHPVGGDGALSSLNALLERQKDAEYRTLIDYAVKRGLEIEYECHAAAYLLPRSLFETHPEYFRMNEQGQRTADYNFCPSNEDAMEIVATRAALLVSELYRSRPSYDLWLDDGRGRECHCPACRHLSASDQQLMVVNRMITEVRKNIPNATMAYLAYTDSICPPTCVFPEEGVFLEYAPYEKYEQKGKDEAKICRERDMLPALMAHFGKKNAKVLEYWYDNSLFSRWKKPPVTFTPNREQIVRDVEEYCRIGFSYIATFGCFLGEDYEALHGEVDITPFADACRI